MLCTTFEANILLIFHFLKTVVIFSFLCALFSIPSFSISLKETRIDHGFPKGNIAVHSCALSTTISLLFKSKDNKVFDAKQKLFFKFYYVKPSCALHNLRTKNKVHGEGKGNISAQYMENKKSMVTCEAICPIILLTKT